ncbi:MAG: helix-turn-helix transcriptional regulator [Christensenellales bacterium]
MKNKPFLCLKHARERKGLSTYEAARLSGVSQSHYFMIENGQRNASPKTAKKIAKILGIDWTKFFDDREGAEYPWK